MFFACPHIINKYWTPMWITDQESLNIQSSIHKVMLTEKTPNYEDILKLLKGHRLRCNILNHIIG